MYPKALLSEKVAVSIQTAIKTGFYKPGDQIPNENQLSEELGVSRATLREALKSLVSQNVLEVRRGIGTFVSEFTDDDDDDAKLVLESMELSHQINDIQGIVKQLGRSELNLYPHLSWQTQEAVEQLFKHEYRTVNEGLLQVFNAIEKMAESRQAHFKCRMLRMAHRGFIKAINDHLMLSDPLFMSHYQQLIDNISDAGELYYEALIDRAMIIHREVS